MLACRGHKALEEIKDLREVLVKLVRLEALA